MKKYSEKEEQSIEELCQGYKKFLNTCKTERECVTFIEKLAENKGFINLEEVINEKKSLKPGDKVYAVVMKKSILLAEIGSVDFEDGLLLIGSHIDAPRLDVKQNPLYESNNMAYLDTHYYGGVKKYQWVTTPMAIHGTVVKKDGSCIDICIGENEDEPVVGVTDLLIHLSARQMDKKASLVIEGEALDVLVGSRAADSRIEEDNGDKEKNKAKKVILDILKSRYNLEESDFFSAELEIVPAGHARDFGLDSSMIMAYGQDDRICAYTSLHAFLNSSSSGQTKICLFADKEEIGSVGATGMHSHFLENTIAELMNAAGQYSDLKLRRALKNSCMLSADVNAAYDPLYADAFEKNNASYLGGGGVVSKFTGSRGKSGSNDANAEYLGVLRKAFDDAGAVYQSAELGKVDIGGGGTIAYIMAKYGMQVVDLGVAILNMHAPFEISSKIDIYETMNCYKAFYEMRSHVL